MEGRDEEIDNSMALGLVVIGPKYNTSFCENTGRLLGSTKPPLPNPPPPPGNSHLSLDIFGKCPSNTVVNKKYS